ncbi:MAG: universal stress protein, partial [Deltaproteobacteria bacterium]|nr:universal stress protein [Deltaproteobacteria bacterium]
GDGFFNGTDHTGKEGLFSYRIRDTYPIAEKTLFAGVVGPIEETIAGQAEKRNVDLIVIGPYRESRRLFNLKMEKGLRSRIDTAKLHPILPCPLLIAPPVNRVD